MIAGFVHRKYMNGEGKTNHATENCSRLVKRYEINLYVLGVGV